VTPDGRSVYVVATGSGIGGFGAVYQFGVKLNGTLTPKTPAAVATGPVPVALALAVNGRSLYVANSDAGSYDLGTGSVSQYTVAAGSGKITPDTPPLVHTATSVYTGMATPDDVAVSATGHTAIVSTSDGSVLQYTLATNGTLSATPTTVTVPTFPLDAGAPISSAFNANGSSFYTTNFGGGFVAGSGQAVGSDGPPVVSQYAAGSHGAFTQMTPSEVLLGPLFVANPFPYEIVLNNQPHGLAVGLGFGQ
jgi:hypothetical protein